MEATTSNLTGLFFLLAVVLLGAVTLGVGYLTYAERRDRQRLGEKGAKAKSDRRSKSRGI
ncbi:MAG TPA: hypothetical protein DCQ32_08585 [Cyanobacteria bacterium UBA8156]|nr:hypothetical protein [Cyanobacteria bacterium UBA8156]